MQTTALKIVDERFPETLGPAFGVWDYAEFLKPNRRAWFDGWISFDCLLADDQRDTIWCGLARLNGDIFYAFDRKTRRFRSLNYVKVGDRYDAKFHRGLLFDRAGAIWAATALLHEVSLFHEAPGGAIVRFDPDSEKLEVVSRPLPHLYIQSIVLDPQKSALYGQTYTPEYFFRYELAKGKVENLGPIGGGIALSQAEQLSIDKHGTVWGGWHVSRAWANAPGPTAQRLWRYRPDHGKPEYLDVGLPRANGEAGCAKIDGTCTGPDGAVYMGTMDGLLCRIDPDASQAPQTAKVEVIGKPAPGLRMAGMAVGPDGKLYGTCGRQGTSNLFSYDPRSRQLRNFGPIFDASICEGAWQIHNLAITADGTIYAGENDVPQRSSYLWEITGAIA